MKDVHFCELPKHTEDYLFTCETCGKRWQQDPLTARWRGLDGPSPEEQLGAAAAGASPDHLSWLQSYLEEVLELMNSRGRKYGPGNIAEFGELGVLVRLSDKLARLRHTTENFEDETSADSWMDVIGYGLIGLAWCRGDWPGSEK